MTTTHSYDKWGYDDPTPYDILVQKIEELDKRIKYLEQENIETTNVLYEIMNSLDNHREDLYNMKTQFGD